MVSRRLRITGVSRSAPVVPRRPSTRPRPDRVRRRVCTAPRAAPACATRTSRRRATADTTSRHYDLTLAYDPAGGHRLTGTADITARATQDLSAFDLDLKGLDVDEVTVEGRTARWNRAGQELTVRPRDDLDDGETFSVTVRYSGTPQTITDPDGSQEGWLRTDDGALALGEPTGSMAWFPGNHHPSDKASYDIDDHRAEGPAGRLQRRVDARDERQEGRTTFTWHTRRAHGELSRHRRHRPLRHQPVHHRQDRPARVRRRRPGPGEGEPEGAREDPRDHGVGGVQLRAVPLLLHRRDRRPRTATPGTPWRPRPGPSSPAPPTPAPSSTNWPTSGTATPSRRRPGGTCGSTRASRRTRSGCGRRTTAATAPSRPSTRCTTTARTTTRPSGPSRPRSRRNAAHISDSPVYERGAMVLHKIRQAVGDDTFYDIVQGWAAAYRHGTRTPTTSRRTSRRRRRAKDFDGIWGTGCTGTESRSTGDADRTRSASGVEPTPMSAPSAVPAKVVHSTPAYCAFAGRLRRPGWAAPCATPRTDAPVGGPYGGR